MMDRKTHQKCVRKTLLDVDVPDDISYLQPPTDDIVRSIDDWFNRRFDYEIGSSWRLPSPAEFFRDGSSSWQNDELMSMKSHLNGVKSRLSSVDIVTWQNHTQALHLGGLVARCIQRTRQAEMCTQAWCKFHEVIGTFPAIVHPSATRAFNTVHLCEAPGAFITSLNHFVVCQGKSYRWQWLASTLNPYYEGNSLQHMIDNDSFITETSDHWYFGADNTGDIFSPDFIESLSSRCTDKEMHNIHLVTADGSIDCANDPAEQEIHVASLHYAEAVTALSLLSPGGSLVLKMFTMYEHTSICLLYVLCCTFKQVHVFKPVTSKPGNSEVYIVAECFRTLGDQLLSLLKTHIGKFDANVPMMSADHIPPSFIEQHRKCCERFMNWQTATILSNIASFDNPLDAAALEQLGQLKWHFAVAYLKRFCVQAIEDSKRVVPAAERQNVNCCTWRRSEAGIPVKRRYTGALVDRLTLHSAPWKLKVLQMEPVDVDGIVPLSVFQSSIQLSDDEVCHWQVECGKPLIAVHSSPFCSRALLSSYCEFLRNVESPPKLSRVTLMSHLAKCLLSCSTDGNVDLVTVCVLGSNCSDMAVQLGNELNIDVLQVTSGQLVAAGSLIVGSHMLDSVSDSDTECMTSLAPLMDLVDIVKVVKEDCSCIISVGALLTRRTVGILYVLNTCFSQVLVYKDGSLPVLFICAMKLQQWLPSLLQHVADISCHLSADESLATCRELLSFVPMSSLCDKRLRAFSVAGLTIWNSLPGELREEIENTFQLSLKTLCVQRIRDSQFYTHLQRLNDDYLKLRIHHFQCSMKESLNS